MGRNPLRLPMGNATILTMTLYLMRHAEAVDLDTLGLSSDAERSLTDKGRRQAKRMGRLLQQLDVRVDRVLSSPFVRAYQTAEIVVSTANWHVRINKLDVLQPDGSPSAMQEAIRHADGTSVLVVGHLPSIASLAESLLGSLKDDTIWFHKSSLAALQVESWHNRPRIRLEWMIAPALAKRLGDCRT